MTSDTNIAEPTPILRKPIFLELSVWLTLCVIWIAVLASGNQNGMGYFHQPQHSLWAPMIFGTVINAGLFVANALFAVPNYLERGRWREYLLLAIALMVASVVIHTLTQKLIILVAEPSLVSISWSELLLENAYLAPFVLIASSLYKFTRDWALHLRERRQFEQEATSLKHTLQETREQMHVLSGAGLPDNFLQITSGNEKLQIPVSAIQFIRSAGNYAEVTTPECTYLAYGALKDFIKRLPEERFVRVHRSYIVGMEHIRLIKSDEIHLSSAKLPIGAVYKKAFFQQWEERSAQEIT